MTENIIIRQAKIDDLLVLLEFEQDLIATERPLDPTFIEEKFHYYDLAALIESDNAEVIVAEINGVPVASGHARIRAGESYNAFGDYAFLGFMFCRLEQRGKGINKLIIDRLLEWARARNLTEIRLQVYDDNTPAIRAYEKVGFKKILTTMRLSLDL